MDIACEVWRAASRERAGEGCNPPAYAGRLAGRRAFTLIELIVVIGIMLALAAIALLVVPSAQDQDRAASGARQLMGWLQIAKTRAMRDQVPRGVRLVPSTANPKYFTDAQYTEQPGDFTAGTAANLGQNTGPSDYNFTSRTWYPSPLPQQTTNANGSMVFFSGVDFYGGFGPNDPTTWPVQVGDFLEVGGAGLMYRVEALRTFLNPPNPGPTVCQALTISYVNTVLKTPAAQSNTPVVLHVKNGQNIAVGMTLVIENASNTQPAQEKVRVLNVIPGPLPGEAQVQVASLQFTHGANAPVQSDPPLVIPQSGAPYRIIRQPRVTGEDPLTLPVNVAVDLARTGMPTTPAYPSPATTYDPPVDASGNISILFAPSGAVIGSGAANDKIIFWVRDISQPSPLDNFPVLVCVYTRSGTIAAQPVNPDVGGNYFLFTVDGKGGGTP
jgi:prepilin-type N-terminal cleavage/methylation domain-containing protein